MRRGYKITERWVEAWWGRFTFYAGMSKPYVSLAISLGPQTYLTLGPFTIGVDFE